MSKWNFHLSINDPCPFHTFFLKLNLSYFVINHDKLNLMKKRRKGKHHASRDDDSLLACTYPMTCMSGFNILSNMSYGATVGASAARPNTCSNLIEFKK